MLRKIEAAVLFVLVCLAFASAGQRQRLRIVPDPSDAGVREQGDVVRVNWVQLSDAGSGSLVEPRSCDVFYATAPAGGNLKRYTKIASAVEANVLSDFGNAKSRYTTFIPNRQGGLMGPGVYYVIAASVDGVDTLYSDYFRLMVASADPPAIVSPKANIAKGELVKAVKDLAPVFMWSPVSGVPYYHIVLSDRPFFVSGGKPNTGVNVIWQAITPNTSIAFGAPDPSNTVAAVPPPLTSGTTYSWMVLNNYGNRSAFTTWDVVNVTDGMAGRFQIDSAKIKPPTVVKLVPPGGRDDFRDAESIVFKWTDLDTNNAASYMVNILREGNAKSFGMDGMGNFDMGLLAWETTVPRGNRKAKDTLSVKFDANSTLTGGSYSWRVYALDSRGAASTDSARSVSSFKYTNTNEGVVHIETKERIGSVDLPVSYVELRLEAVNGPALAPLLFYTGGDGTRDWPFSAGTYRITAVKEGYFTYTATINVSSANTLYNPLRVNIPMSRPEAVIYGKVMRAGADSSALSAAKVTAVSSWGDTVSTVTDDRGGYTFACRAADWTVTADKPGFAASPPGKIVLKLGDDTSLVFRLARSPYTLSGVVRNSSGQPIMGARVRVMREGVVLDELASTPQNGSYVFYLNAGTYTVMAERPGFTMFSRSGVAVTGTTTQDITLREGAVVVSGVVMGKSWVSGGYVTAPIPSARVLFAETVASPDTFIVTGDAVFGKFSVSLPKDMDYKVTVSAAGFAAQRGARDFNTRDNVTDNSKQYAADPLFAFATMRGRVTGVAAGVPFDVIAQDYASGRIVASVRGVASGRSEGDVYEVRNIPDGRYKIVAGADGYVMSAPPYPTIGVTEGGFDTNTDTYDFAMAAGSKSIRFNLEGYRGNGTVKVLSPLNKALPFVSEAPGVIAWLDKAGDGEYSVGIVPDDINRLELSYHKFSVSGNQTYTETLYLPYTYTPPGNFADAISNDTVTIKWPAAGNELSNKKRIAVYYRSEGSVRFDSVAVNVSASTVPEFRLKPVRNGCNLYYYFRIYLENGDIYGSGNQLYSAFVTPNSKIISRLTVEPGVAKEDTLVLPSSYKAEFKLNAFYGDQFVSIDNAGSVSWKITGSGENVSGSGRSYSYTTKSGKQDLVLRATFKPSSSYKIKPGDPDFVEFPIRVTGQSLDSLSVSRKGVAGPVFNTDTVSFRVEAFDRSRRPVMVSPVWTVLPAGAAASMGSDGLFKPNKKFVGMAAIEARAGGRTARYTDPVAEAPKQRVDYPLRPASRGDTANTLLGMRVVFDSIRAKAGENTYLKVGVPQLTNFVHRGTESYRMADSVVFDVAFSDTSAIGGNVVLEFDIPPQLRDAAKSGDYDFRVARWFNDSLRWIPLDSTRVSGGVVSAWLLRNKPAAGLPKSRKKVLAQVSRATALADSGRYALVMRTNKASLSMSVSPHPFSPYIRPVKEYGQDAKAGTCIKVNVQAPGTYVRSVKVLIYNVTGKMVWGIEMPSAYTGAEHMFWWNGRTSRGVEVWSPDDYYDRNKDRPMCRNGRYYVMVIMTDTDGKQMRVAKPLVLMK